MKVRIKSNMEGRLLYNHEWERLLKEDLLALLRYCERGETVQDVVERMEGSKIVIVKGRGRCYVFKHFKEKRTALPIDVRFYPWICIIMENIERISPELNALIIHVLRYRPVIPFDIFLRVSLGQASIYERNGSGYLKDFQEFLTGYEVKEVKLEAGGEEWRLQLAVPTLL